MGDVADLSGFPVNTIELPRPPVPLGPEAQERLVLVMAAITDGGTVSTPEAIVRYLDEGFPVSVDEALERPHERRELGDLVDVLLFVMQSPASGR